MFTFTLTKGRWYEAVENKDDIHGAVAGMMCGEFSDKQEGSEIEIGQTPPSSSLTDGLLAPALCSGM